MEKKGAWGPGRNFDFFFNFFWSPKWPRMVPPGPGGAWGAFSSHFGALGGPGGKFLLGPWAPLPPYYPYPGDSAVGSTSGAIYTGKFVVPRSAG